jgi:heme/copper-type cytochrome/quinol oxidase subunit 3
MLAVSLLAGGWLQTFGPPRPLCYEQQCAVLRSAYDYSRFWRAGSVMCKGLLLVLIGSERNTSLYHFMYERPNTVPMELFLLYGTLLFGCMQTASVWFAQLREVLGSQTKWRLVVRIQHIIYALIVAAAWVYPLQLHSLRVIILSTLIVLNAVGMLGWAETQKKKKNTVEMDVFCDVTVCTQRFFCFGPLMSGSTGYNQDNNLLV